MVLLIKPSKLMFHARVQEDYGVRSLEFAVRRFGRPTLQFELKINDQTIQAPLGLFFPGGSKNK